MEHIIFRAIMKSKLHLYYHTCQISCFGGTSCFFGQMCVMSRRKRPKKWKCPDFQCIGLIQIHYVPIKYYLCPDQTLCPAFSLKRLASMYYNPSKPTKQCGDCEQRSIAANRLVLPLDNSYSDKDG